MNEIEKYSIENLEKALFGDKRTAIDALMYACFNVDNADWIQEQCLKILNTNADKEVKSLAVTCLGHVARMHLKINKEKVMPVLNNLLSDPEFSGVASDALDDIEVFIK